MIYAIWAAAIYLLWIGVVMKTEGLPSATVFKFVPVGISIALIAVALGALN